MFVLLVTSTMGACVPMKLKKNSDLSVPTTSSRKKCARKPNGRIFKDTVSFESLQDCLPLPADLDATLKDEGGPILKRKHTARKKKAEEKEPPIVNLEWNQLLKEVEEATYRNSQTPFSQEIPIGYFSRRDLHNRWPNIQGIDN